VKATWSVAAPADAGQGSFELSARATYRGAKSDDVAAADTSVPYGSVPAAFGNTAISDDGSTGTADLDGGGRSLSQQALAAAGITSGGTVTHDGLTFTWPTTGKGAADNIVAGGQSIRLGASGTTLGFLGTANNGTASGTGTIAYTDGTTQSFSLAFSDWWDNAPAAGGDTLVKLPYLNQNGGKVDQPVSVYGATVPLQAGKTVDYLTLPNISQGTGNNQTAMHIFAIAVG
jgi:hypothetical protein